jgi:hypothetical protein
MNAAEILVAVQEAGATLRVEGDSLVASNASRIAPDLKAAIRENKPHLITALVGSGCKVEIVELPQAQRYRKTFAFLQIRCPSLILPDRWRQCVADGKRFLAKWGEQAESFGWSSADLFGLAPVPTKPHPSFRRLSRYDLTGLCWSLEGREVIALTEATASIKNPKTGTLTTYRRFNKPALGPLGDSLADFQ